MFDILASTITSGYCIRRAAPRPDPPKILVLGSGAKEGSSVGVKTHQNLAFSRKFALLGDFFFCIF